MFLYNLLHLVLLFVVFLFFYQLDLRLNTNQIIHLITVIVIIEFYSYKFHKALFDFQERKQRQKEKINKDKNLIQNFLNTDLKQTNLEGLTDLINKIDKHYLEPKTKSLYENKINEKLIKAKRQKEILEYKQEIDKLNLEKSRVKQELEYIQHQKREETLTQEERVEEIIKDLDLENNPVFKKEFLSEEELEVLKKENYIQSNEFSILTKKVEPCLIKKVLNHSNSHTFLVWDTVRLLEILKFNNIVEHKTVDADITFKHKNKIYAIEVETGNLLKKKKQLDEKVNYLNKKYDNRWLFLVTNRNLVSKYKQFGLCTQRKQLLKTLQKWLKLNTQEFGMLFDFLEEK
jgi:hypothetical protein